MSDLLIDWLLDEGCRCTSAGDLVESFCHTLRQTGAPVERLYLGTVVPHPQVSGIAILYDAGKDERREIEIDHQLFEQLQSGHRSPMRHLLQSASELRALLKDGDDLRMSDLTELGAEGYTDFIGFPLNFMGKTAGGITFTTKNASGFSERQCEAMRKCIPALSAAAYLCIQRLVQSALLRAYLGQDAGRRVHRGQVHRGQGTTLRAAIFFADIRGFTKMTESQPRDTVLDTINAIFEVTVGAVQKHGGQVLKFMGDGLLASFEHPTDQLACQAAEQAAIETHEQLAVLATKRKDEGKTTPGLGVGLHLGEVMYGNIGAPGRLDFTVIGAAVNLAARIEALCSTVGEDLLMSADFVGALDQPRRPCGEFELKGVPYPTTVFAHQ
jgi:adenylate cyclase